MVEELKKEFQIESDLIKGKDGVFELRVDGKLLFSKKALHRFPEPGEIQKLIQKVRDSRSS